MGQAERELENWRGEALALALADLVSADYFSYLIIFHIYIINNLYYILNNNLYIYNYYEPTITTRIYYIYTSYIGFGLTH